MFWLLLDALQVQYTYLQVLLQRSVTAWLQQPAASKEMPRPPLAMAMGTNSWELLKQQANSAAVADVLGMSSSSKDVAAAAAASAVAAVGPSTTSGSLLAVQVSRQALKVLLQLVKAVKQHCQIGGQPDRVACYSLAALQPAGLVQLLCISLLSRSEGVDYCCRAAAGALLVEVTGTLQDLAQLQQISSRPSSSLKDSSRMQQLLNGPAAARKAAECSSSLGVYFGASGGLGLSDESCALVDALEPLICKVLMPVAGRQLPGFRGKCLVKTALEALLVLVRGPLVADMEWSQVWAAIGGTFWLSR